MRLTGPAIMCVYSSGQSTRFFLTLTTPPFQHVLKAPQTRHAKLSSTPSSREVLASKCSYSRPFHLYHSASCRPVPISPSLRALPQPATSTMAFWAVAGAS